MHVVMYGNKTDVAKLQMDDRIGDIVKRLGDIEGEVIFQNGAAWLVTRVPDGDGPSIAVCYDGDDDDDDDD